MRSSKKRKFSNARSKNSVLERELPERVTLGRSGIDDAIYKIKYELWSILGDLIIYEPSDHLVMNIQTDFRSLCKNCRPVVNGSIRRAQMRSCSGVFFKDLWRTRHAFF